MTPVNDDKDFEQWLMFEALESEHRAIKHKYTDIELLAMFPEIKPVLPSKIKEWEIVKKAIKKSIFRKLERLHNNAKSDFEYWFCRELIKHTDGLLLLEANRHIARLRRQVYVASGKQPNGQLTDEQIEMANQIPIVDLYDGRLKRSGSNLIGLCPFHEDKRPSFTVFQKTNSCWCFGCQQGGNSIKFVMLLNGYSFPEAVKYLLGL